MIYGSSQVNVVEVILMFSVLMVCRTIIRMLMFRDIREGNNGKSQCLHELLVGKRNTYNLESLCDIGYIVG